MNRRPGRAVDRADIETLGELTAGLASPLSEFCAANLYLFRAVHDYRWAEGAFPALSGQTYDGARQLTPLIALSRSEQLEAAAHLASGAVLYPIAETDAQGLATTSNPADSDYLFEATDLASLRGEARKGRRNLRNQFRRAMGPRDEVLDARNAAAALVVLDGWIADVAKPWAQTDYVACREALDLQAALGLEGLISYTSAGEPAGFLLATVRRGVAIVHFAKGRRTLLGVFPHLFSRFAEIAAARVKHLNFEQDLGNPGFRQSKRAYGPVSLLGKHRLSREAALAAMRAGPEGRSDAERSV
jgi:hypothetical protein